MSIVITQKGITIRERPGFDLKDAELDEIVDRFDEMELAIQDLIKDRLGAMGESVVITVD